MMVGACAGWLPSNRLLCTTPRANSLMGSATCRKRTSAPSMCPMGRYIHFEVGNAIGNPSGTARMKPISKLKWENEKTRRWIVSFWIIYRGNGHWIESVRLYRCCVVFIWKKKLFQSSFGAVSEQFQSSFRAVSEQFRIFIARIVKFY